MNPNQLSRELRNLPGNVLSHKLPGGSIITAVMDRNLMTWSDRGGASRIFGEIWSEHCWAILGNGTDTRPGIFEDSESERIIRLDANPRIAAQAARNHLSNPDFLVISESPNNDVAVRSVDAKFAFDRLRRVQVSPDALRSLVELPGSLVRQEIEQLLGRDGGLELSFAPGAFVGPRSLLNDYYYQRLITGDDPDVPESELHLIPVDFRALFQKTSEYPLIALFEELDQLGPYSAETGVLFGMYYLRLASAARWFAEQSRAPLLSLRDPEPVPVDEVVWAAEQRIAGDKTAYQVVSEWFSEVEQVTHRQTLVRDAARLPVRMSELRSMLERAGLGDDKKRLKMLRGALDRAFMRRLIEEGGEVPAEPAEPISQVVKQVRTFSRQLRPEMLKQAKAIVQGFDDETG